MDKILIIPIGGAGKSIANTIELEAHLPELKAARYYSIENEQITESTFDGIDKLIVICGLGGNTGTRYTPVIVEKALEYKVPYVTVLLTIPFFFEGKDRIARALKAKEKIESLKPDKILVINNEKLIDLYSDQNLLNIFSYAEKALLRLLEESLSE